MQYRALLNGSGAKLAAILHWQQYCVNVVKLCSWKECSRKLTIYGGWLKASVKATRAAGGVYIFKASKPSLTLHRRSVKNICTILSFDTQLEISLVFQNLALQVVCGASKISNNSHFSFTSYWREKTSTQLECQLTTSSLKATTLQSTHPFQSRHHFHHNHMSIIIIIMAKKEHVLWILPRARLLQLLQASFSHILELPY